MGDRPRGLSKTASMPAMDHNRPSRISLTPKSTSGGGFFSLWRSRSSSRRDHANEQLAALEGKELREAMWRQQQREQQALAAVRPLRVLRYSPPTGSTSTSMDTTSMDDDTSSAGGSVRGIPSTPHSYDQDVSTHRASIHSPPHATTAYDSAPSRLGLTFSRLSLSSSAGAALAEYKAKKYDVAWKKDDDCVDCQVCHLAFTKWSRRRHHCRVCGELVCEDCSPDQVHIAGRFARPKRACTACWSLLEAVMHGSTDGSVQLFVEPGPGTEWVNKTPPCRQYATTAATNSHDRLAEIQRVTVAGKKARRQGDGRQCVISAAWLRAWLAFTRGGDDAADDLARSFHQHRHTTNRTQGVSAPGPIDNLSLLVVKQGKLVPRDRLECCQTASSEELTQAKGDYQVIPFEIWEVFYRYYGGGPMIDVSGAPDNNYCSDQWTVDVASVLRWARALATNPNATPGIAAAPLTVEEKIIERALTERHDPYNLLVDVSGSPGMNNTSYTQREDLRRSHASKPFTPWASASAASTSSTTNGVPAAASRPPPIARSVSDTLSVSRPPGVAKSSTGDTNRSHVKPEPPHGAAAMQDGGVVPRPKAQPSPVLPPRREPDREPDSRDDRHVHRDARHHQAKPPVYLPGPRTPPADAAEPSAARAASAFALAMKEARLKQQRAIIGSVRGVGTGE